MAETNTQNVNDTTTQTTQPEGNGTEKTFTQEQVNQIVSERLARERSKADTPDTREQELAARENKLTCKEWISESHLPVELLDVFDTSDAEKFKTSIAALKKAFPMAFDPESISTVSTGMQHGVLHGSVGDRVAALFRS